MEMVSNRQMNLLRRPTGSGYQQMVFEAAARLRSVRAAAAELDMTPREVSRSLRELEAAMRIGLFTRRHGTIGLTRAGEALFLTVSDEFGDIGETASRVVLRQVV